MKFIAAIMSVVLSGCAAALPTPMITFHADKSFNDNYRMCIESACDHWREATGGAGDVKVHYDLDTSSPVNMLSHELSNKIERLVSTEGEGLDIETRYAPETILGQTHGNLQSTGPIRITLIEDKIGQGTHYCTLTVMHELGHAFGLNHAVKAKDETYWHKGDIMYPGVYSLRTECLKPRDLTQFCLLNDCSESITSCDPQPDSLFQ